MARPLPNSAPNQPLLDVLRVAGVTQREMDQMLRDGADEIERLLPKLLEKHLTGNKVKAAQLALVLRELKVAQSALWGDLGTSLRSGVSQAVTAAAEAALDVLSQSLAKQGVDIPGWRASLVAQAQQGLNAVLAKSQNGIPLSRAVYRAQALSSGQVDRTIKRGLLLGNNHKAIAKSVKSMIDPNVAGGVSYAAHRLARTEINNAYKTAQENRYADEPWVTGMRWNLSKTHPKRDECNDFAEHGVYPVGQRPKSHPSCLCYLTPEQDSPDDFVEKFLAGDYNEYIDKTVYTHAPASELLCP